MEREFEPRFPLHMYFCAVPLKFQGIAQVCEKHSFLLISRSAVFCREPPASPAQCAHVQGPCRRSRVVARSLAQPSLVDPDLRTDHDTVGQREQGIVCTGRIERLARIPGPLQELALGQPGRLVHRRARGSLGWDRPRLANRPRGLYGLAGRPVCTCADHMCGGTRYSASSARPRRLRITS